ncbi:SDR family oxidoreductase [Luteimonas sp. RD2P54]|uniref:SDR family oxidoreductase n=1 Tax=Luteimonas endophytica TaxID=3042023 RepID=A0ABT6JFF8_9GAMM|nr:SDR family oxidoreductase [Luteimonas endophytica]MDH5824918.1 SDR family oxidoreductase [Luteimonas endophytica]
MSQGSRPEVVVVTGASAGVGRAVACEFARHGARVGLIARGHERLQTAAAEVRTLGGQACPVVADVADADAVEAAAERIEEELGPIGVWINSAMVTVFAPVSEVSAEEYRRVTQVTYLGTVHGTLAAMRRMRARNRGTIVQVGSALAYRAIPLQSAYCAAKFAVRGFTDSLRVELMHDRCAVDLVMVQLSAFNTPQFDWARNKVGERAQPVPPIFQPELAARGIRYAAYAGRREVCVGWPAVRTIWGNKLAPWAADLKLRKAGYEGQTTGEPQPARPGNLFDPPPGDPGAHGRFDDTARDASLQLFWTMHRAPIAAVLIATVLASAGLAWWAVS